MTADIFTLGFASFSGIGTIRFEKLLGEFGSAENAWRGNEKQVISTLGKVIGEKFIDFRKAFAIEKYVEEVQKKDIHWFTPQDAGYPFLLKKLEYPPFILFAKGNTSLLEDSKAIGIVGTRKVTGYGVLVTEMLTRDLVADNFTIVSGMALGVDGIAHRETLRQKGKTIAVLGSGVDIPLPREHEKLYQEILDNGGLVVSTFQPGESAGIGTFPARNAIIAGLSLGVVVTEGTAKSGALITANYAKKFGRPIFSVPGQITSQLSKGTNNLIKAGAIPIQSTAEILDTLGIMDSHLSQKEKKERASGTPEELEILTVLENGPLLFDEIVRTIGKDSKTIGSLLSLMELKGLIKNIPDGKYSI